MQGPKFMPWMESITRSFEILFLDLVIAIVGGSFMAYGIQSENENIQIVLFGFGLFVIAGAASSAMIKIIADSVSYALYYSNNHVSNSSRRAPALAQNTSTNAIPLSSQEISQFSQADINMRGRCTSCGFVNGRSSIRCTNCSEILQR